MPNEPKNGLLPPSTYVNFLRVANNQSEFFLSFGQVAQEQGGGCASGLLSGDLSGSRQGHAARPRGSGRASRAALR